MLYYIKLYCVILYWIILYKIVSYCIISYHIRLYYYIYIYMCYSIIWNDIMLYYIILYLIILQQKNAKKNILYHTIWYITVIDWGGKYHLLLGLWWWFCYPSWFFWQDLVVCHRVSIFKGKEIMQFGVRGFSKKNCRSLSFHVNQITSAMLINWGWASLGQDSTSRKCFIVSCVHLIK